MPKTDRITVPAALFMYRLPSADLNIFVHSSFPSFSLKEFANILVPPLKVFSYIVRCQSFNFMLLSMSTSFSMLFLLFFYAYPPCLWFSLHAYSSFTCLCWFLRLLFHVLYAVSFLGIFVVTLSSLQECYLSYSFFLPSWEWFCSPISCFPLWIPSLMQFIILYIIHLFASWFIPETVV